MNTAITEQHITKLMEITAQVITTEPVDLALAEIALADAFATLRLYRRQLKETLPVGLPETYPHCRQLLADVEAGSMAPAVPADE